MNHLFRCFQYTLPITFLFSLHVTFWSPYISTWTPQRLLKWNTAKGKLLLIGPLFPVPEISQWPNLENQLSSLMSHPLHTHIQSSAKSARSFYLRNSSNPDFSPCALPYARQLTVISHLNHYQSLLSRLPAFSLALVGTSALPHRIVPCPLLVLAFF